MTPAQAFAALGEIVQGQFDELGRRLARLEASGQPQGHQPPAEPPPPDPEPPPIDPATTERWWQWSKSWPGLAFQATQSQPEGRFDLEIPGGCLLERFELRYRVHLGQVAGDRQQFHFVTGDAKRAYPGGVLSFLALMGTLGSYMLRTGLPGDRASEGAGGLTKVRHDLATASQLTVLVGWQPGQSTVDIVPGGRLVSTRAAPTPVKKAITCWLGFGSKSDDNPAEAPSLGWEYYDLEMRAAGRPL